MNLEREIVLMTLFVVVIIVEILSLTLSRIYIPERWINFSSIRRSAHIYAACLGVVKISVDLLPLNEAVFMQIFWAKWWFNLPLKAASITEDIVNFAPYAGMVIIYVLYAWFQKRYSENHPAALDGWIREEFREFGNPIVIGFATLTFLGVVALLLSPHERGERLSAILICLCTGIFILLAAWSKLDQRQRIRKAVTAPAKRSAQTALQRASEIPQLTGEYLFAVEYISEQTFSDMHYAHLFLCTCTKGANRHVEGKPVYLFLSSLQKALSPPGSIVRITNPGMYWDELSGAYEMTILGGTSVESADSSGEASV